MKIVYPDGSEREESLRDVARFDSDFRADRIEFGHSDFAEAARMAQDEPDRLALTMAALSSSLAPETDDETRETAERIRLVMTSGCSPEQYDAMLDGEAVAYLRLRHGYFRVECPHGGKIVYDATSAGDGMFDSSQEREFHLGRAKEAIARAMLDRDQSMRRDMGR